jgi:hypothetical protein
MKTRALKNKCLFQDMLKSLSLFLIIFLLSSVGSAQNIHKGSLVGIHTVRLRLNPGVTPEQYMQKYEETVVPVYEASRPGWHMKLLKALRGDDPEAEYGTLMIVDSEQLRDKYYNPDGTENEAGKASLDKLASALEEMNKLGTAETVYTDWLITEMPPSSEEIEVKPGNLICPHVQKISLQPGVSIDDYSKARNEIISTGMMKIDPAWKSCMMKSIRGVDPKDTFGVIYIVDTENDRDKYYNSDGTDSEMGKQVSAKMQPLLDDIDKYGTIDKDIYVDWLVLP